MPNPYGNEPVITVDYNKAGFRNPENMSDWEIAVAGDSFTELGYLRYEELFTTILGQLLSVRVLNLGTTYTGPLTQLSYLRDYGVSKSTKHAVIVFFEGNDLSDLDKEYEALIRMQETGRREERSFKKNTSLVKAFDRLFQQGILSAYRTTNMVNAYFKSAQGDIPVTLTYAPPGRKDISAETVQHLEYFLGKYSDFGAERQITVWLAYMPCKHRILHGRVEFADGAVKNLRSWRPTDLPEVISALCDRLGVRFIDLTPALVEETTNKGQLVYNSVFDTHLNARGSLAVARQLGRQFVVHDLRMPRQSVQSGQ